LQRSVEQPLGAPERVRLVSGAHREVDGTDHLKTIP